MTSANSLSGPGSCLPRSSSRWDLSLGVDALRDRTRRAGQAAPGLRRRLQRSLSSPSEFGPEQPQSKGSAAVVAGSCPEDHAALGTEVDLEAQREVKEFAQSHTAIANRNRPRGEAEPARGPGPVCRTRSMNSPRKPDRDRPVLV
ncbi:uncharacterized protein AAES06_018994 isoform 1-T1 [Glossophaga mutica]